MPSFRYMAFCLIVAAGVAWGVWWRLPPVPAVSLPVERNGSCEQIHFSADNKTLATVHRIGEGKCVLRLRDTASGRETVLQRAILDFESITSVAFSPDGQKVATRWSNREIHVFDRRNGRHLCEYRHPDRLKWEDEFPIVYSSSGQLLIYGPHRNSGTLCDVETGEAIRSLFDPGESWSYVEFAKPGFAVAFKPGRHPPAGNVEACSISTGRSTFRTSMEFTDVFGLCFSYDGNFAVSDEQRSGLKVWRNGGGEHSLLLDKHTNYCVISPEGHFLAVSGVCPPIAVTAFPRYLEWIRRLILKDGVQCKVELIDVDSGRQIDCIENARLPMFSPDGKTLAVVGSDGSVHLYDFPLSKSWAWPAAAFLGALAMLTAGRCLVARACEKRKKRQ